MSPKQHKLYIGRWLAVKKLLMTVGGMDSKEADAKRHEIHREALGVDKSSKLFTNTDLDRVLDAFQVYLGLSDPRVSQRAVEEPRKRAIYAIEHLGFPDEYTDAIARDVFHSPNWRSLGESDLWKLKITLTNRARSRAKKESAAPQPSGLLLPVAH